MGFTSVKLSFLIEASLNSFLYTCWKHFKNCFFSGRSSFKNGETTTASVGRICTERSVGISVDVNPFEPHILASNMAHAIGHNLGFGHDDSSLSLGSI